MSYRAFLLNALFLFSLFVTCLPLYAGDSGDRVQFGRSIVISEGETAGDLVCVGCSIRVEGTCQDAVAVGGSIIVNGTVKGDMVTIGGGTTLGENATVDGDLASIGGHLSRHPNSVIHGSVSAGGGTPVLLGLVLIPFIPVVLFIALIIWLIKPRQPRPQVRAWQPPPQSPRP